MILLNEEITYGSGSQLVLTCEGCQKDKLADQKFIAGVLAGFPAKIGLAGKVEPTVFTCPGENGAERGVSGVALISEAHILIHTFPEQGRVFSSIFSAKEFDLDFACQGIMEAFGASSKEAASNRSTASVKNVARISRARPRISH